MYIVYVVYVNRKMEEVTIIGTFVKWLDRLVHANRSRKTANAAIQIGCQDSLIRGQGISCSISVLALCSIYACFGGSAIRKSSLWFDGPKLAHFAIGTWDLPIMCACPMKPFIAARSGKRRSAEKRADSRHAIPAAHPPFLEAFR